MEKTYEVLGMSCVICKNNVEKVLNGINGVEIAKVNLLENEVTIVFDENIVNESAFVEACKSAGYDLLLNKEKSVNTSRIKLILSIVLVIALMFFSMTNFSSSISSYLQMIISIIVIILNREIYLSGFNSLFKAKNPNMDSLIFIASITSFLYSLLSLFGIADSQVYKHIYFETSAMVLVITSIGRYIEGNTKEKTVKVIRGLTTLIPMQANLLKDGEITIIPIDSLKKRDTVVVKAGESIPRDGEIILGSSTIDESLITGESLPVEKTVGDLVIGGTININGTIQVKISTSSSTSILSNIINLTKKATSEKLPIERLADTISKYFVFGIFIIATITFIVWMLISKNIGFSLNFALSVLVISCPCALGLATPAAIAVALGKAANNGILIKKPEVIEIAHKLKNIVFDKTGTLTKNKLHIVEIKKLSDDFENVLSSLEKTSNHPIAKAILDRFDNGNIEFDTIEFIPGEGIKASLYGDVYLAGNNKLIDNLAQQYLDYAIANNYSYISVSRNKEVLGVVYLNDVLRETSKLAINNLYKRNIKPIMCTGDNKIAALKIAKKLDINEYLFEVKPEDKHELIINKKKEGIVGMVGDGVNDSIALSSADISISIQNASDIASASSDIILMKNDLNDISFLYDLSKKTMRIIKQNLFWALCYNTLCIPIAAGVFYKYNVMLNPMIGSVAMWISSMFVLLNALRINMVKKEEIKTMNKTIVIEGMMCKKCEAHAKEALEALGLDVVVSLEDKKAYVKNSSIDDQSIIDAIEEAGYEVKEIING